MFLSFLFHGFWTQDDTGVSMFVSFVCGVSSASWDQTHGRWHEYLHLSGNIQCQTVRFKYICPLSIFVHPLWIAVNIKPRGEGCNIDASSQLRYVLICFNEVVPTKPLCHGSKICHYIIYILYIYIYYIILYYIILYYIILYYIILYYIILYYIILYYIIYIYTLYIYIYIIIYERVIPVDPACPNEATRSPSQPCNFNLTSIDSPGA